MGDVKLSAKQTAQLLKRLEDGARNLAEARAQILAAMAARTRDAVTPPPAAHARKKR